MNSNERISVVTSHLNLLYIFDDSYPSKIQNDRTINISFSNDLIDVIYWIIDYKNKLDEEIKLRLKYESVQSAYEQYQTTLNLVKDNL
jgi:hypothetical protein